MLLQIKKMMCSPVVSSSDFRKFMMLYEKGRIKDID